MASPAPGSFAGGPERPQTLSAPDGLLSPPGAPQLALDDAGNAVAVFPVEPLDAPRHVPRGGRRPPRAGLHRSAPDRRRLRRRLGAARRRVGRPGDGRLRRWPIGRVGVGDRPHGCAAALLEAVELQAQDSLEPAVALAGAGPLAVWTQATGTPILPRSSSSSARWVAPTTTSPARPSSARSETTAGSTAVCTAAGLGRAGAERTRHRRLGAKARSEQQRWRYRRGGQRLSRSRVTRGCSQRVRRGRYARCRGHACAARQNRLQTGCPHETLSRRCPLPPRAGAAPPGGLHGDEPPQPSPRSDRGSGSAAAVRAGATSPAEASTSSTARASVWAALTSARKPPARSRQLDGHSLRRPAVGLGEQRRCRLIAGAVVGRAVRQHRICRRFVERPEDRVGALLGLLGDPLPHALCPLPSRSADANPPRDPISATSTRPPCTAHFPSEPSTVERQGRPRFVGAPYTCAAPASSTRTPPASRARPRRLSAALPRRCQAAPDDPPRPRMGSKRTPVPKPADARRRCFGSTTRVDADSGPLLREQERSRATASSGSKRRRARGPPPRRTAPSSPACSYTHPRSTPSSSASAAASMSFLISSHPSPSRACAGEAVMARKRRKAQTRRGCRPAVGVPAASCITRVFPNAADAEVAVLGRQRLEPDVVAEHVVLVDSENADVAVQAAGVGRSWKRRQLEEARLVHATVQSALHCAGLWTIRTTRMVDANVGCAGRGPPLGRSAWSAVSCNSPSTRMSTCLGSQRDALVDALAGLSVTDPREVKTGDGCAQVASEDLFGDRTWPLSSTHTRQARRGCRR